MARCEETETCFEPLGEVQTRSKSNGTKHPANHYYFFHETWDVGKSEKCVHTQTHKYIQMLNLILNIFR